MAETDETCPLTSVERERYTARATACEASGSANVHLHEIARTIRRYEATVSALQADLARVVEDNARLRAEQDALKRENDLLRAVGKQDEAYLGRLNTEAVRLSTQRAAAETEIARLHKIIGTSS